MYQKEYHKILSSYFQSKPLYLDEPTQKKPTIRKLVEQPWQQTKGEMWDEVTETLCDLSFIQAKAGAKMTYELLQDFNYVLNTLPENEELIRLNHKRQKILNKFTRDLTTYSNGEISELEVPVSVKPWSTDFIDDEIKRINTCPNRLDKLNIFSNFIGQEAGALQSYVNDFSGFTIQHVLGSVSGCEMQKRALDLIQSVNAPILIRHYSEETVYNPRSAVNRRLEHNDSALTPDGSKYNTNVIAICMTPDGSYALTATGSIGKTMCLWNLDSGKCIMTMKLNNEWTSKLALSPNAERGVSVDISGNMQIWNLNTGQCIHNIKSEGQVKISCDCRTAILIGHDKKIHIWDLENDKDITEISSIRNIPLAFDGTRLVLSQDDSLTIFDIKSNKIIHRINMPVDSYEEFKITPDCRHCITRNSSGNIQIWDLNTEQCIRSLWMDEKEESLCSITNDACIGISLSGFLDVEIKIRDLESGRCLRKFKVHEILHLNICMSSDGGKVLISLGNDNIIKVWDIETSYSSPYIEEHEGAVNSVSITDDGRMAITAGNDHLLRIWDCGTLTCVKVLEGHQDAVTCVKVTGDGRYAASGSEDHSVRIWNLITFECLHVFKEHWNEVSCVEITSDGHFAISGSKDTTIRVWDIESGISLHVIYDNEWPVTCLEMMPDGKSFISGSEDETARIWEITSGKCIFKTYIKNYRVKSLRIAHDESKLMLATFNLIRVYNIEAAKINYSTFGRHNRFLYNCIGHSASVECICLTPDSRWLFSGSCDRTLRIWDIKTGQCILVFVADSSILSVTVSDPLAIIGLKTGEVLFLEIKGLKDFPVTL